MIYHYIYQACIRCQVAFGATKGKYVEFKANLPLIALWLWWIVIAATISEKVWGYNFLFSNVRLALPLAGIVIILIDRLCLSSKETQKYYEEIFRAWPKKKRLVWDICTAAFLILTPALMLYTLPVHKY